jgi:hypothetical protein
MLIAAGEAAQDWAFLDCSKMLPNIVGLSDPNDAKSPSSRSTAIPLPHPMCAAIGQSLCYGFPGVGLSAFCNAKLYQGLLHKPDYSPLGHTIFGSPMKAWLSGEMLRECLRQVMSGHPFKGAA